ncbi:hypothetical protein [Desulfobacula sp.]
MNKAQTKALVRLEQVSDKDFHDVTQKGSIPVQGSKDSLLPDIELNEVNAPENLG